MTREDVEGKDQEADDDFRNEPVYKSHIQTDLVEIKKKTIQLYVLSGLLSAFARPSTDPSPKQ